MKPSTVAELWVRFQNAAKVANDLLREEVEKYGYTKERSAVRHIWDAKANAYLEAASDLRLWGSTKDKEAIDESIRLGLVEVDYEHYRPWPDAYRESAS